MRSRLAFGLALVAVGLWTARCGSSQQPRGSGSGGGAADAGSGSDAGVGTGGSGGRDAGIGAGGGRATDAGSGSGGSGGGGVGSGGGGGGGGSGGGGGGVSADCVGIVPDSPGSSFTFGVQPPAHGDAQCTSASSDESGNLVASNRDEVTGGTASWELFSPAGDRLGHIDFASLFPQAPGWEGVYRAPTSMGPAFPYLGYWLPDGTLQKSTQVGSDEAGAVAFRSWPNGTVVVTLSCSRPPGVVTVRRFDATGIMLSEGGATGGCNAPVLGAAGDAKGNSLVLLPGGGEGGLGSDASDVFGAWFDPQGNALTPFFVVAKGALTKFDQFGFPADAILLHAVSGGGAVLSIDWTWRAFIPSGSPDVQPAPDWLTSHDGYDFTVVRGARAYALLPRTAGDPHVIELYSTEGSRCGTLTFPVGGLTTGADGSVIGASGSAGCTKTVWPGLLR